MSWKRNPRGISCLRFVFHPQNQIPYMYQVTSRAAFKSGSCSTFTWESRPDDCRSTMRTPRFKVSEDQALLAIPFILTASGQCPVLNRIFQWYGYNGNAVRPPKVEEPLLENGIGTGFVTCLVQPFYWGIPVQSDCISPTCPWLWSTL